MILRPARQFSPAIYANLKLFFIKEKIFIAELNRQPGYLMDDAITAKLWMNKDN